MPDMCPKVMFSNTICNSTKRQKVPANTGGVFSHKTSNWSASSVTGIANNNIRNVPNLDALNAVFIIPFLSFAPASVAIWGANAPLSEVDRF